LLLLLRCPDRPGTRVGITVSSRVGNAVVRNRLKRWIREYVRRHAVELPAGDVAIVAKGSASACGHDVVDQDLHRLFDRARDRL
jgi:ribonuclease P protein component